MANQTVTTAINYDDASISGLLNGEALTINGGGVTINSDVRWNQQAAVLGNVTTSSTLGGYLIIDGTAIWEVPFSASSGNVPTQAALGSNSVTGGSSGATGELTRVWATGSLTPATAGAAMPTSGFIKLRSKTGTFTNGETITLPGGATITASGSGKRSWLHVVGRGVTSGAGSTLNITKLGQFSANGDWYDLGTTDGTDNQTFQYPVSDQCPAIWIETAAGSGVYEIWLNALDRWTDGAVATSDRRGMYFVCDASTGAITIAARGANSAGLKPPTGCKVRIPNIIMSNADGTTPAWDSNILPGTISMRYAWNNTGTYTGGMALDKVSCNWRLVTNSAASINLINSGFGGNLSFQGTSGTTVLNNVGVGIVDQIAAPPFTLNTSFGGGALTDVFSARRLGISNGFVFDCAQSNNFTFTRCRADSFGTSGTNAVPAGTCGFSAARTYNFSFVDCIAVGGTIGWSGSPCFGFTVKNAKFASRTIGTTQTVDATIGMVANTGASDIVFDGFTNFDGLSNVHPYSQIAYVGNSSARAEVKNIGSASAPYDMGSINPCGYAVYFIIALNMTVRRVYVQNTRVAPAASFNTVYGFDAYNLWGDTADSQILPAINGTIRGGRFTPSVSGQAGVFGTHWMDAWTSTTTGIIGLMCNEPTPVSADQCSTTLATGSGFTSNGNVSMKSLTDEVTWTMPHYALGVTGFANTAPTVSGTNVANHTLEFQYDLASGSGFNGSWLTLNAANLSAITVNPAKGVKLKIRAKVNTASSTNALASITIATITNSVAQQIEYPLPGALLTVNGLVSNSRVKVTRVDNGALLAQDSTSANSLTFDLNYSGAVRVEARNASGATAYRPWVTQTTITTGSTTTVTALQEID